MWIWRIYRKRSIKRTRAERTRRANISAQARSPVRRPLPQPPCAAIAPMTSRGGAAPRSASLNIVTDPGSSSPPTYYHSLQSSGYGGRFFTYSVHPPSFNTGSSSFHSDTQLDRVLYSAADSAVVSFSDALNSTRYHSTSEFS